MNTALTIEQFVSEFRETAGKYGFPEPIINDVSETKRWAQHTLPDLVHRMAEIGDDITEAVSKISEGYINGDFQLRDWIVCGVIPSLQSAFGRTEQMKSSRRKIEQSLPPDLMATWRHWADTGSW